MKILVANLGSTSFKYRLFDMELEEQLARGGIERIGASKSACFADVAGKRLEQEAQVADHAAAVQMCLSQLTDPEHGCLSDAKEVAAIGFKAVHGGRFSGVQSVTDELLDAMEEMNEVAPAHNPPYIRAMRLLANKLPEIPLVAAFETGFHQSIDPAWRYYGIPYQWATEYQVQRWGFHGASHRFISERTAVLLGRNDLRIVSCHLGGSSSLCAIRDGRSVATTMGMSPQTGLMHNNRCGDFDPFAIPMVMKRSGLSLDEVMSELASRSGLLGLSGVSGDIRDLEEAKAAGNSQAALALDVFVADVRRHLGGLMIALEGLDAIVFTGGIGENGKGTRAAVCQGLDSFGIELDSSRNHSATGEASFHADTSRVQLWIIPTNEELIVARQAKQLLEN